MDENEILEEILINENSKTYLFYIIKNISPELLIKIYRMGYEDGTTNMENLEYSTYKHERWFGEVIEEIYKRHVR